MTAELLPAIELETAPKPTASVIWLHGLGADGNDLIDIGRAWQNLLPDAAFVSPHAPRPCGRKALPRKAMSGF